MIVQMVSRMIVVALLSCGSFIAMQNAPMVFAAQTVSAVPANIDTSAHYFFFLHNYYVETKGPDGDCKYHDLLEAFADQTEVVISEIRSGKIIPCTYAAGVVAQVNQLLDAGVVPEQITVAGHSKGAVIALCAAAQLQNEKINYVIMAGCEIAGIKKHDLYPNFTELKGRILSIYANSDTVAASCSQTFSAAEHGLAATEIELESDKGHRLFFAPETVWLEPMQGWLSGM